MLESKESSHMCRKAILVYQEFKDLCMNDVSDFLSLAFRAEFQVEWKCQLSLRAKMILFQFQVGFSRPHDFKLEVTIKRLPHFPLQ